MGLIEIKEERLNSNSIDLNEHDFKIKLISEVKYMDSSFSDTRNFNLSFPEGMDQFPLLKNELNCFENFFTYWKNIRTIFLSTKINRKSTNCYEKSRLLQSFWPNERYVNFAALHKTLISIEKSKYNQIMIGDMSGPCGFDSAFLFINQRHWFSSTYKTVNILNNDSINYHLNIETQKEFLFSSTPSKIPRKRTQPESQIIDDSCLNLNVTKTKIIKKIKQTETTVNEEQDNRIKSRIHFTKELDNWIVIVALLMNHLKIDIHNSNIWNTVLNNDKFPGNQSLFTISKLKRRAKLLLNTNSISSLIYRMNNDYLKHPIFEEFQSKTLFSSTKANDLDEFMVSGKIKPEQFVEMFYFLKEFIKENPTIDFYQSNIMNSVETTNTNKCLITDLNCGCLLSSNTISTSSFTYHYFKNIITWFYIRFIKSSCKSLFESISSLKLENLSHSIHLFKTGILFNKKLFNKSHIEFSEPFKLMKLLISIRSTRLFNKKIHLFKVHHYLEVMNQAFEQLGNNLDKPYDFSNVSSDIQLHGRFLMNILMNRQQEFDLNIKLPNKLLINKSFFNFISKRKHGGSRRLLKKWKYLFEDLHPNEEQCNSIEISLNHNISQLTKSSDLYNIMYKINIQQSLWLKDEIIFNRSNVFPHINKIIWDISYIIMNIINDSNIIGINKTILMKTIYTFNDTWDFVTIKSSISLLLGTNMIFKLNICEEIYYSYNFYEQVQSSLLNKTILIKINDILPPINTCFVCDSHRHSFDIKDSNTYTLNQLVNNPWNNFESNLIEERIANSIIFDVYLYILSNPAIKQYDLYEKFKVVMDKPHLEDVLNVLKCQNLIEIKIIFKSTINNLFKNSLFPIHLMENSIQTIEYYIPTTQLFSIS